MQSEGRGHRGRGQALACRSYFCLRLRSEFPLWTNESSGVWPSANHRPGQRPGRVPELMGDVKASDERGRESWEQSGGSPVLPRPQQTFKLRKLDLKQREQNSMHGENSDKNTDQVTSGERERDPPRIHRVTGDTVTGLAWPQLSLGRLQRVLA